MDNTGMNTRTRSRPAVSLLLTSVAFFMVALDALVVITALPAIHAQLGGSLATLEWTVNAYGLAFAAGIVTASALGDRFGRRRVYVAGLILFSVASAACAVAPTPCTARAAISMATVGAIVQLSWHWIFWVNVPIGFAAAIASARLLPESHGPARRTRSAR